MFHFRFRLCIFSAEFDSDIYTIYLLCLIHFQLIWHTIYLIKYYAKLYSLIVEIISYSLFNSFFIQFFPEDNYHIYSETIQLDEDEIGFISRK